ncbi:MAG: glycosyltransferase family 1 protein [candidate division Zixibacteria bacterium]
MVPTLIVTLEQSGMDKYSQELARRLPVRTIESRRYLSFRQVLRLAFIIWRVKGIVHLPNQHFARYALFRRQPFIVTVHDIARFRFSFDRESLIERLMLKLDVLGIKRAAHVIATSQHTKDDIIQYLGIPEEKISLIYNGSDCRVFGPRNGEPLDGRYILYVGSERPRKNLGRLFEAFAELRQEFADLKLIKVGPVGRSRAYRQDTMRKLSCLAIKDEVVFVDYVQESDLASYYASAELLAYPSFYEGFGLPPLEAMCSGCPVVTSNTSSLPEVVGDAGIMVSPTDTGGWVEAMRRVLTNRELRNEMITKGLEQSKKFSWDRTAQQTLEVYRKFADG